MMGYVTPPSAIRVKETEEYFQVDVVAFGNTRHWKTDSTHEVRISILVLSEIQEKNAQHIRLSAARWADRSTVFNPLLRTEIYPIRKHHGFYHELWLNRFEALFIATKAKSEDHKFTIKTIHYLFDVTEEALEPYDLAPPTQTEQESYEEWLDRFRVDKKKQDDNKAKKEVLRLMGRPF